MLFLYKPLKAADDPIWLWPSGKPKAVKSLILLDEIQAVPHRAHTAFPKSDFVQNTGFVFLMLVWLLAGFFGLCFPLGIGLLFHCMSLLCRSTTWTDEYVPPEFLTYSHAKDNSLLGHAKWDCVLNQHAAAVWSWPEARGWLPCIHWEWVQLLGKH